MKTEERNLIAIKLGDRHTIYVSAPDHVEHEVLVPLLFYKILTSYDKKFDTVYSDFLQLKNSVECVLKRIM